MCLIKPFNAYRPDKDLVSKVVSKPYHLYEKEDINRILYENQYSFLHVIKPEFGKTAKSKPNSPELFEKSRKMFRDFVSDGILKHEKDARFYVYEQMSKGESHTGIIGCASVDDYLNGKIRVHEQTLLDREVVLKNYLEVCDINAEPVCLTYPASKRIDAIIGDIKRSQPVYNFKDEDGKEHRLWLVERWEHLRGIKENFAAIPDIYIADGHHRISSSVLLAKEMRLKNPKDSSDEPYNFFMALFFADNQLKIYEYNRVLSDLNGMSCDGLLERLSQKFDILPTFRIPVRPEKQHIFGMYVKKKWYRLNAKPGLYDKNDPSGSLGAAILSDLALAPVFNIHDLRADKRIGFVSGAKGTKVLQEKVDSGQWAVAFTLCPVKIKQLYRVADCGKTMPPKSTWIEPKLLSGLTVYNLEIS